MIINLLKFADEIIGTDSPIILNTQILNHYEYNDNEIKDDLIVIGKEDNEKFTTAMESERSYFLKAIEKVKMM